MSAQPKLELCDFLDFVVTAYRDGVRKPCLAYQYGDRIVCLRRAASIRRLAHEYRHWKHPDAEHEPWYAFDVFSYNPVRLNDKHGAVAEALPWLKKVLA